MYIFYCNATSATGRALAEALHIPGGTTPPRKKEDVLIRWGNSEGIPTMATRTLNKKKAIELATDKMAAWRAFQEAGIASPEIVTAEEAKRVKGKIHTPSLGRRRHHSQGKDIVLCLQQKDVIHAMNNGSDYFSEYVPTNREYRVHVFGNRAVRINQKLLRDGAVDREPQVRNYENGYVFGAPRIELKPVQTEMAIRSVQCLGLDFGAVDLIISDSGHPYVLEVNTGPALVESEHGVEIYVEEFRRLIQNGPNN
jgi:glutathione synthase/RimK-type ligase-like ATP-grasp enzyme